MSAGPSRYAYDQADRLITATIGGITTRFRYDGDGNRVWKQCASCAPVTYTLDVNTSLPVILADGSRKMVWGLGLAYAVTSGGTVLVPHTDGLGSVRALSDGSGSVLQRYQTDAFGVPRLVSGPSAQPFGFTGEPFDRETGLLYLRARYYDPQLGRFINRDRFGGVLGVSRSQHRYTYAHNNPVNRVDPSGQVAPLVIGGALLCSAYCGTVIVLGAVAVGTVGVGVAAIGYAGERGGWDRVGDAVGAVGGVLDIGGQAAGAIANRGVKSGQAELKALLASLGLAPAQIQPSPTSDSNYYAKKSRLSGKERASDIPSWAKGAKKLSGESGKDAAKRLLDERYGAGNYPAGPGSEFNKLRKYFDRT